MAWIGQVNKAIDGEWSSNVLYYVKEALKEAGWELTKASTGNGFGRGATNFFTSPEGNSKPGFPNTGSGGGGGVGSSNDSYKKNGAAGASGIVIIRYPTNNLQATGGEISQIAIDGTDYTVHQFKTVGTSQFNIIVVNQTTDVEYLIVGGGGGGGLNGGGNGGQVLTSTQAIETISSYDVVVGAGGAETVHPPGSYVSTTGFSGSSSSVFGLVANGGAGGSATVDPGSGAGGQANGYNGGHGIFNNITGHDAWYAAGGASGYGTVNFNTNPPNRFGGTQGFYISNEDNSAIEDPLNNVEYILTGTWYCIREPEHDNPADPRREFVFVAGAKQNQLLIKYSRALGFIEGNSSLTQLPTAADGVVITDSTTTDSEAIDSSSAATFDAVVDNSKFINVVTSNTSIFGTFPFYIWTYAEATGSCHSLIVHEAVLPGTTSELDQDPTYRIATAGGNTALALLSATAGVNGNYWEAYGLPNATIKRTNNFGFCTVYAANNNQTSSSIAASSQRLFPPITPLGNSPYSGDVLIAPVLVGIEGEFPKGFTSGIAFGGYTNQNVLDTFNIDSANPKIIAHYPNAREAIFLPWVPNVIPQI